jgi:hypothetical protein
MSTDILPVTPRETQPETPPQTPPKPPPSGPSRLAWGLGLAGLLPFFAAAGFAALGPAGWSAAGLPVLWAYGSLIVSFLGGIHWGIAMRDARPAPAALWWGVTPSLVAWVGWLLPLASGLWATAAALVMCWLADRLRYPRHGLQAWMPLRHVLTLGAVSSCVFGATLA